MDVMEAIRTRKSIRGYKPDPVPQEVLKEILEVATRSPSAMNTQPWEITVVTGEVLDNIRKSNVEMLTSGNLPNPDLQMKPYEGIYRQRQVDLAIQIFQLMGIAREDREKRDAWMQRGFRFFDAPAAIILCVDKSLDLWRPLCDVGAIIQTICLAAVNYGLGTCINAQGIMYPEVVRRFTGIPESKLMVICIAIGYPDWDFPANKLESKREPLENNTTWHGFDTFLRG
jgi:nitroreductase